MVWSTISTRVWNFSFVLFSCSSPLSKLSQVTLSARGKTKHWEDLFHKDVLDGCSKHRAGASMTLTHSCLTINSLSSLDAYLMWESFSLLILSLCIFIAQFYTHRVTKCLHCLCKTHCHVVAKVFKVVLSSRVFWVLGSTFYSTSHPIWGITHTNRVGG